MNIPIKYAYHAPKADADKLESEFVYWTDEDYASGMIRASDGNGFSKPLLPSLGDRIAFRSLPFYVVEIKGRRYKVEFNEDWQDDPSSIEGKTLDITPTDLPLTETSDKSGDFEFFGQPNWIQGAIYPLDLLGNPCYHLFTVENGWGDSGNYNFLIGFDADDVPNIAYFEASCC